MCNKKMGNESPVSARGHGAAGANPHTPGNVTAIPNWRTLVANAASCGSRKPTIAKSATPTATNTQAPPRVGVGKGP